MSVQYNTLTDEEIIKLIVSEPHNEEAALYLFYERYRPLFTKLCLQIYESDYWLDDCIDYLFDSLRGKDFEWRSLTSFEGRSRFSTWIDKVAYNKFVEKKPKLIGKLKNTISFDNNENDKKKVQIANPAEEDYELRYRKVLLIEAVSKLKNAEQKFVILKTLQEYNSKEIAQLLMMKWNNANIKKYNKKQEALIPDAGYIDVLRQRAKKELKLMLVEMLNNK